MLDEQFTVPDWDLKDEDYIVGECSECFNYSRYLNVDMLCPKCVKKLELDFDQLEEDIKKERKDI